MKKIFSIFIIIIVINICFTSVILSQKNNSLDRLSLLEEYDMVIINPEMFSGSLQPLINHKNNVGIKTISKTTENIYNEFAGRDKPEKIKNFIRYALESWHIKYVFLVGNKDLIPIRNIIICLWDIKSEFISDLYYSDIFDENGTFCSWDSNGDMVFSDKNMSGLIDRVDLYPDVCVGRLLCRSNQEVAIIVNKIITYETNTYDATWFKKIILCGGDFAELGVREALFPIQLGEIGHITWEGEYVSNKIAEILDSFQAQKLYASNFLRFHKKGLSIENINSYINEGAGFITFYGHGTPTIGLYTNFPLMKGIFLPYPSGFYTSTDVENLQNGYKLPIAVFLGCNCGNFSIIDNPIAWEFVQHDSGGSIASIANTRGTAGLYSSLCTETLTPYLMLEFFRIYEDESDILGEIWSDSIKHYLDNERGWSLGDRFSEFNWHHSQANYLAIQEWILLGDPSLKIGGYDENN